MENTTITIYYNKDSNNGWALIFIVMGPFILGMSIGLFICMYENFVYPIVKRCNVSKCNSTCIKNNSTNIKNNKLSKSFIKTLNDTNKIDTTLDDCSICIDPIEISSVKCCCSSNTTIIYLGCSHIYHKECLQNWVESQIHSQNNISCPMCRDIITTKTIHNKFYNQDSDSDTASESSYFND